MHTMNDARESSAVCSGNGVDADLEEPSRAAVEPTLEGAFSDDGVDLTLVRWMLQRSPTDRLRAAQDLIDTAWVLRSQK